MPSLQTKYFLHLVPTTATGRSLGSQRWPTTGPVGPATVVVEAKVIARTTERRKDFVATIVDTGDGEGEMDELTVDRLEPG